MSREREILTMFNEAKDANDKITMIECVTEMKQLDPAFIDLMMNVMFDEEDDDDEDDDDMWFDEE